MKQKSLSNWLKFIIIGVGICFTVAFVWLLPELARIMIRHNSMADYGITVWNIMIAVSAFPVYIALVFAWLVASNIGKDRSFTMPNSKYLKWISVLAAFDSAFVFCAGVVMFALKMNSASGLVACLVVVFAGVTVTVASAALSHLVVKAAALQEQSDATI